MTVDSALFPPAVHWLTGILYGLVLLQAVRMAPWAKLGRARLIHVFLGTTVAIMFLWHLKADVQPGLSFHLLGVTAVTLMFGWSFAVISASLALVGVYLNTGADWPGFPINAMVSGIIPITLTQILLILIRWYLPKQFFVYVLVNGFLTAGLVAMICGYLVTLLLVLSGAYSYAELGQTFLPFFPLMFLPEAMLNGWIMVVLVAFRPDWVYSFSDEQYLKGK